MSTPQLSSSTTQTTPSETDTLVEGDVTPTVNTSPQRLSPTATDPPATPEIDTPVTELRLKQPIPSGVPAPNSQTKVGRFSIGFVKDSLTTSGECKTIQNYP